MPRGRQASSRLDGRSARNPAGDAGGGACVLIMRQSSAPRAARHEALAQGRGGKWRGQHVATHVRPHACSAGGSARGSGHALRADGWKCLSDE
jgi:hypothetical protein